MGNDHLRRYFALHHIHVDRYCSSFSIDLCFSHRIIALKNSPSDDDGMGYMKEKKPFPIACNDAVMTIYR